MPHFGTKSRDRLETCDREIQDVLNEAIKYYDFSVVWGHRSQVDQDRAYEVGNSRVRWPYSKHNKTPSRAVDVVPYPGGFNNDDREFYLMATYILRAAALLGVDLRWGGHWRNFKDLAHFELG